MIKLMKSCNESWELVEANTEKVGSQSEEDKEDKKNEEKLYSIKYLVYLCTLFLFSFL